ncbi:MAG: D-cysteine desulfhydrase family protein [Thermotogaceae bacterium]|nr:D-cysteine desulfhydrase family protein [Thermotogaceae bacterium]
MKLDLARKPTPLEKVHVRGKTVFVKRDDLTEFVASGNKIRKLEYLLGEAVSMGADVVMTCGAVQSNHARATTYLSIKLEKKPVIFLKEWHPGKSSGNFLLDTVMGAEIHVVTPEEYEEIDRIMEDYAKKLEKEGKKAYIIPEGGSSATGSKGYVDMVHELSKQIDLNEVDAIYVATSSAGTHAGILAGLKILGYRNVEVRGVVVHRKPKEVVIERIRSILTELGVDDDGIILVGGFEGPDYAIPTEKDVQMIKDAGKSGIILDPVYTAKAFRGMMETMGDKEKVIFVHTGGTFGLFAQNSILEG